MIDSSKIRHFWDYFQHCEFFPVTLYSLVRGNDSHLGLLFFERKQSQEAGGIFRPLGHCLF